MRKNLMAVVLLGVFLLAACVHTDEQSQKTTEATAATVAQGTESSQGTTIAGITSTATEAAVTTVAPETQTTETTAATLPRESQEVVVCCATNPREMVFLCTDNGEYDVIDPRDYRFATAISQRDGNV